MKHRIDALWTDRGSGFGADGQHQLNIVAARRFSSAAPRNEIPLN